MEILIEKAARRLTLWEDEQATLSFPVVLGAHPVGHKLREGDGRTPEGLYYVCTRNAQSKYHLALGVSYPGPTDAQDALLRGEISPSQARAIVDAHERRVRPPWDTPLGGFIMIHGGGCERGDWTQGCIALANEDMEQLFSRCPLGVAVRIVP